MHNKKEKDDIIQEIQKDLTGLNISPRDAVMLMREASYWVDDCAKYICTRTNKLDDPLMCFVKNNCLYLVNRSYSTIIMFHFKEPGHLHIDDILMKTNDIGNGSVAMEALLKYAIKSGVHVITGDLSSIDDDHKNRRDHYYAKFGFDNHTTYVIKHLSER